MHSAASYLITFRDRDGSRLPLLRAVTGWLSALPALQVIIVEQDSEPRLTGQVSGANISVRFAYNPGPFNKSWGLNVAARYARHELLVTGDADMIIDPPALERALSACRQHYDAVNPYARLVDLSEDETRAMLRGATRVTDIRRDAARDRLAQGEQLCFCGGICVFRREVFFALGGMDERFLGWGGEDDAMSINLERYTTRIAVQRDTPACHLWHPRDAQRYRHPHYRNNLALASLYRSCSEATLARWRARQRDSMGDPQRYADTPG